MLSLVIFVLASCANAQAPRLLSEGKPTSSSTLFDGGSVVSYSWPSSNAVQDIDNLGNHCNWFARGSVAIAAGTDLFWQVDLEDVFAIKTIKILGFNIGGYSDNVQFNVCNDAAGSDCTACGGLVSATPGSWVQTSCSLSGRFIRLTNQNSDGKNWHFCRIAVYGIGPVKNTGTVPFSIKFGGQAWGMAKSTDNGATWTPIATVDMHTYQHTHMIGEVRDVAQEGMIIKFQPLTDQLASDLGYPCPKLNDKCDGTCKFDSTRSNCFNWDNARIFLHELKINGQTQDFSDLNVMKSNGWDFKCRTNPNTCNPSVTIVNGDMVRQDGANFYYTYTFTGVGGVVTAGPTFSPTMSPSKSPSSSPTMSPSKSPSFSPTMSPSKSPTFSPTMSPSKSPTMNPSTSPTVPPTKSPSKFPTAEDFIIKVKAFHGNPKDILDKNKIQGQPEVDIDMYGFEQKLTPISRRLLNTKSN